MFGNGKRTRNEEEVTIVDPHSRAAGNGKRRGCGWECGGMGNDEGGDMGIGNGTLRVETGESEWQNQE